MNEIPRDIVNGNAYRIIAHTFLLPQLVQLNFASGLIYFQLEERLYCARHALGVH
jgi:hypothetical protein